MPHSRLLVENKYAVGAAVVGFLLALVVGHGSLTVGLSALALIAGSGWVERITIERHWVARQNN